MTDGLIGRLLEALLLPTEPFGEGFDEIHNMRQESNHERNTQTYLVIDAVRRLLSSDAAQEAYTEAEELHTVASAYDSGRGMVTGPAVCDTCDRNFGYEGSEEFEEGRWHSVRMGFQALIGDHYE